MTKKAIKIQDIHILKYVDPSLIGVTQEIFAKEQQSAGHIIAERGQDIQGLYIVLEGYFEIFIQGSTIPIARMTRGESAGEMSLLNKTSRKATARIQVGEEGAQYIFSPREKILEVLDQNHHFASGFHRGVAQVMSNRLVKTNADITRQISGAMSSIEAFMKEIEMISKLDETKSSLDQTGFNLVSRMNLLKKDLKAFGAEVGHEDKVTPFLNIIDEIMLGDSQNFDRICQMIDQLSQHLNNLTHVIHGDQVSKLKGDQKLFQKSS